MSEHTNESPITVVAGRFLTGEEEERWRKALRDPVRILVRAVLTILFGFFTLQALVLIAETDWLTILVLFPLLAVCVWVAIAWLLHDRRQVRRENENALLNNWQDERMIRGGSMLSFYRDHVAHTTMRGTNTVCYADVTHFCETADGIAFGDRRYTVYLRSMDLTMGEMQALRRLLMQVLKPSLYRLKAPAYPIRHEPLPTVRFANYDTVIARAVTDDPRVKRDVRQMIGLLLPQLAVYAVIPALMLPLFPWPLLSVLVWEIGFLALGCALGYGVWRLSGRGKDNRVWLVFTENGVARRRDGVMDFIVQNRVRYGQTDTALLVQFADGEQLEIPWDAVENAAALRSKLQLT